MGRVKQRDDGRYQRSIYVGKNESGNNKYIVVYGHTKSEADEKANQIRLQLKKGIDITAQRDTFRRWCDRFLEVKSHDGIGHAQKSNLKIYCNHLAPLFDMEIIDIRTSDIQSVIYTLSDFHDGKPGLSKKTLIEIRSAAKNVFRLAIENRVLDYNPAEYVRIPKNSVESHREALTDEQQAMIRDTPHRAQTAAMVMLYSGLRRGEAAALLWSDIDLLNGTISVNKAYDYRVSPPELKTTKTEAGIRIVHIPQILINYLADERKRTSSTLVIHNARGGIMTAQAWKTMWSSYMTTLNAKYCHEGRSKHDPCGLSFELNSFTPHQLRHTFCSLLYLAGVDVLTARDQMGHADVKTTMSIYTHLDKKFKKKQVDKLDAYLAETS